ncbi:MAG: hypothetical protein Q9M36_03005 [Sulfurovum sp.]|nr:hypothetical protein [Sulfurovum sp.]
MKKFFSLFLGVFVVMALFSTTASAALTVTAIDTADFMAVASAVLVALAAFYGVIKALSLLR